MGAPKIMGYGRTSTSRQEMSPALQQQQVEAWVEYQIKSGQFPEDAEYLGFFCDEAVSSKQSLLERPKGQMIPVMLSEGDCLVVAKHDRAFRSGADTEATLEKLTAAGIRMVMLNLNIDTSTHDGIMMATIFGAAARWERENIIRRTVEALNMRKEQGRPYAPAPIGWKIADGPSGKEFVPDVEQRKFCRWVRDRIADGYSCCAMRSMIERNYREFGLRAPVRRDSIPKYALHDLLGYPKKYMKEIRAEFGRRVYEIAHVSKLCQEYRIGTLAEDNQEQVNVEQ